MCRGAVPADGKLFWAGGVYSKSVGGAVATCNDEVACVGRDIA